MVPSRPSRMFAVSLLVVLLSVAGAAGGERKFPHFIHLRPAQAYNVHLPISADAGAVNGTTLVHLSLYTIIPDTIDKKAYLLFKFHLDEFRAFVDIFPARGNTCHDSKCSDLMPHLHNRFFGNLRCQFVAPNGTTLATPPARVEAYSAKVGKVSQLIGTCPLSDAFVEELLRDEHETPPGIRVLREGDRTGAPAGAHSDDDSAAFESFADNRCSGPSVQKRKIAKSLEQCRSSCAPPTETTPGCLMWQWSEPDGCFQSTAFGIRCSGAGAGGGGGGGKRDATAKYPGWVGGRRRHDVWDAIDTAREEPDRSLISFGCSMPVFGNGAYMDRIPQWLEFQLYNFPRAHFFVYLRGGGNSRNSSSFDPSLPHSIPGVVGGSAALYPYILNRIVTVVWLPRDVEFQLEKNVDSFQRRDENEFLYRARHLSEWASASVDYDEYFAPTHIVGPKLMRRNHVGSTFSDVKEAIDPDWNNRRNGASFYPLGPILRNVSQEVHALWWHKWPTEIPEQDDKLYLETQRIAVDSTRGKLGKYIVRPLKAKLLWTHMPLVPADPKAEEFPHAASSRLVVGNVGYDLLHFRDRDWAAVADNSSLYRPYRLTLDVAKIVKERLWQRYSGMTPPTSRGRLRGR